MPSLNSKLAWMIWTRRICPVCERLVQRACVLVSPLINTYVLKSMSHFFLGVFTAHRFTDNKGYQRHKISSKFSDDLLDTSAAMSLKPVRYDHQPHEVNCGSQFYARHILIKLRYQCGLLMFSAEFPLLK